MNKLQVLIENIRMVILAPETFPPEQLRIFARDYAEACVELNRRMQQCLPHVRSGNVAEAVRLSEIPPNLPELYSLLDFSEREHWCDIATTLGFDEPPPLSEVLSRELNEAYIKFSPLEPLLRWHRLHALNDSPLRDRLTILRAITHGDSENLFWQEDREKFEKARIGELEKEVSDAVSSKNVQAVRFLYDELNPSLWSVEPPTSLKRRLCSVVLQGYVDELRRCFGAFEFAEAVQAYETIRNFLQSEGLSLSEKTSQAMRPALNWINETQLQNQRQSEFLKSSDNLQRALEKDTPSDSLERLYYALNNAANEAGIEIPEALQELYQSRISSQESHRTRKARIAVLSVICLSLLVGVFLFWGIKNRMFGQQVANALEILRQIESDGRYEDIAGTIQRIENETPAIAKEPSIAGQIEKLRGLEKQDQSREADFQRNREQVNVALNVPVKPNFEEMRKIGVPLSQMEKLARTPSEKNQHTELKRKYDQFLSERKREIDAKFSEELTSLSEGFRTFLRTENSGNVDEAISRMNSFLQEADRLLGQENVSPDLLNSCNEIIVEITTQKDKLQEEFKQKRAFERLNTATGHWDNFQSALNQFSVENGGHFAAEDISEVLKELDDIRQVSQTVSDVSRNYARLASSFGNISSEASALWISLEELKPRLSAEEARRLFLPYGQLEILSKRIPPNKERFASSKKVLETCMQREVWPWVDKDHWYYLVKKPSETGSYPYITSFATAEKTVHINAEGLRKYVEEAKRDEANKATTPVLGQYRFAISAMKRLDGAKDDAVKVACVIMLTTQKVKGIDPILKCILIGSLVEDMSNADPLFAGKFEGTQDIIKKSNVDLRMNWMDVQSKNILSQRSAAGAVLDRLADLKALVEETQNEIDQFQKTVEAQKPRFEWAGYLAKKQNEWVCEPRPGFSFGEPGALMVLRLKPDGSVQSREIGSVLSGGEISINPQAAETNLLCLPVFFRK